MSQLKTWAPIFRAALVVALLTALALTLAYQARAQVRIDVGGSYDAPFVARFFDAENDGTQTYRWTRDTSRIALDAQALTAPWTLQMRLNGFRPNRPARLTVEMNGAPVDTLTVTDGWDIYTLQGNGAADVWTGDNRFILRADTFVPQREIEGSADTRKLGVVVDWIEWTPTRSRSVIGTDAVWLDLGAPPVMPPWATVTSWAAALALLYVTARVIGVAPKLANLGAAASVMLVALAFALARVWSGYFTAPFLTLAVALTILASLLAWLLPRFAARLALPLDARALTALCALILVSVALKWGGAWYPQFRSSDLLFHAHRLEFVTQGNLFFTSELPDAARRVVPYPPALYVALASLTVFFQDFSTLLLSFNALADSAAILAIYFAARKIIQASNQKNYRPRFASRVRAVGGAALGVQSRFVLDLLVGQSHQHFRPSRRDDFICLAVDRSADASAQFFTRVIFFPARRAGASRRFFVAVGIFSARHYPARNDARRQRAPPSIFTGRVVRGGHRLELGFVLCRIHGYSLYASAKISRRCGRGPRGGARRHYARARARCSALYR